jgi:hypothetical protein
MINWLKNLFGEKANTIVDEASLPVLEPVLEVKAEEPKKETTAKPKKSKSVKVDLDAMKKDELLAHAKGLGLKVNASMNKQKLIDTICKQ